MGGFATYASAGLSVGQPPCQDAPHTPHRCVSIRKVVCVSIAQYKGCACCDNVYSIKGGAFRLLNKSQNRQSASTKGLKIYFQTKSRSIAPLGNPPAVRNTKAERVYRGA